MPDITINVPPTSTGQAVEMYREGSLISDPAYPYVIPRRDRVVSALGTASTFRTPVRAVATQNLFSLENKTGSTVLVAVRRLWATVDTIVAKAVLSPYLRVYRVNAASPTNGTVLSTMSNNSATSLPAGTVVEARGDSSADGTGSATTLTATVATPWYWERVVPRMHTLVGQVIMEELELIPSALSDDYPLILNANQFLVVRMEASAALLAADFHFFINCAYEVYTRP